MTRSETSWVLCGLLGIVLLSNCPSANTAALSRDSTPDSLGDRPPLSRLYKEPCPFPLGTKRLTARLSSANFTAERLALINQGRTFGLTENDDSISLPYGATIPSSQCLRSVKLSERAPHFLTVVVTTRNDDHAKGGNTRFQNFLDRIEELGSELHTYSLQDRSAVAGYKIPLELIVTEWNPPISRPNLTAAEDFRWPDARKVAIRIITVPPAVHKALPGQEKVPLHEWAAKNVAIRRARGEYVITTNLDDIFHSGYGRMVAKPGSLKPGVVYSGTVDKTPLYIPLRAERKKKLVRDYCYSDSILHPAPAYYAASRADLPYATHQPGDYLLLHRKSWTLVRGIREVPTATYVDVEFRAMAAGMGLAVAHHVEPPMCHQSHTRESKKRPETDITPLGTVMKNTYFYSNGLNWGLGWWDHLLGCSELLPPGDERDEYDPLQMNATWAVHLPLVHGWTNADKWLWQKPEGSDSAVQTETKAVDS